MAYTTTSISIFGTLAVADADGSDARPLNGTAAGPWNPGGIDPTK